MIDISCFTIVTSLFVPTRCLKDYERNHQEGKTQDARSRHKGSGGLDCILIRYHDGIGQFTVGLYKTIRVWQDDTRGQLRDVPCYCFSLNSGRHGSICNSARKSCIQPGNEVHSECCAVECVALFDGIDTEYKVDDILDATQASSDGSSLNGKDCGIDVASDT